jgi:hypothetical protein
MFVGKARSLPLRGAPEKSFWVVPASPTNIRLGWKDLRGDKHSSLLRKLANT